MRDEDVKDRVHTTIRFTVGWRERVKILFGGTIEVRAATPLAEVVEVGPSKFDVAVMGPSWWPHPKQHGEQMMTAPTSPPSLPPHYPAGTETP